MGRIAKEKIYDYIQSGDDISMLEDKIGKAGVMKIIDKFCNELRKPKPIPDKVIVHYLQEINRDTFTNISNFTNNEEIRNEFWRYIEKDT